MITQQQTPARAMARLEAEDWDYDALPGGRAPIMLARQRIGRGAAAGRGLSDASTLAAEQTFLRWSPDGATLLLTDGSTGALTLWTAAELPG